MFWKNDRPLYTARKCALAVTIVLTLLCIGAGILLCVFSFGPYLSEEAIGELANGYRLASLLGGIFLIVVLPLVCWLGWIFTSLRFAQMFDLKLIRNKLYGINDPLLEKHVCSRSERRIIRRQMQQ